MEGASGRGCCERPSRVGAPWACPVFRERAIGWGPRSRVGQRPGVHVWGRDPHSCARREGSGTPAAPRPALAPRSPEPFLPHPSRFCPPVADGVPRRSALRRPRMGRAESPPPYQGSRSGVSGPRAPPRGHQASCTRAARVGGAALLPSLLRGGLSPCAPATSHLGAPLVGARARAEGDTWGRCPFLPPLPSSLPA